MDRDEARRWIRDECEYPGWIALVEQVYDRLPSHLRISQVYQKWAVLRFDLEDAGDDDPFREFIRSIEDLSTTICDTCGGPGSERVVDHWERTICAPCALRVARDPASIFDPSQP
jgi:hypothetical protein